MEKYSQDDQASIMATLQVVQSKGWSSSDSDPMQFHIILGEKIRYLEEQLIEHNYAMEEMEQKDKTIRDLKDNLEHKRNIVENLEEEINRKDGEHEELQKDHDSKQTIFENLEMFVRDRIEEINELRKNNISLGNQIADGILMEKKISIQESVKENLNDKLKTIESLLIKRNLKCVECEQTFLTKRNLDNHVQIIHEANLGLIYFLLMLYPY